MAAIKYLTGIDLTKQELQNARIQNLASAPADPVEGQIYHNTTSHRSFVWNGTEWVGMDALGASMTGTDIIDAINGATGLIDDDNLSSNVNGAISASHSQGTDTGTTNETFTVGSSGVKIKNSGGTELQIRNNADNDYADLRVKNLAVEGTTTTINSNTVNIGDSNIVLNSDVTDIADNSNGGITVKRVDNASAEQSAQIYFDNSTGRWKTIGGPVTGLVTTGIANKVVQTIGDASGISFDITHNLNTQDAVVSIRQAGSPYAVVYADIEMKDVNTTTIKFAEAPASNAYVVTIVG